jgi:hypothetical protein
MEVTDDVRQATHQHCFDKLREVVNDAKDRVYLVERLRGVVEADLPRLNLVLSGRFKHQLSNQVIGDHMGPNLIANAMRFFATQMLHLHRGFYRGLKKGAGTNCRNGPKVAAQKLVPDPYLTPFLNTRLVRAPTLVPY